MDESAPINTINTTYKEKLTDKINIITGSVEGLIAKYIEKLSVIKELQKNKSGESDGSDGSDGNDGNDGNGDSGETQECSELRTEFNEYKKNVNAKIAELLATMDTDASRLEELNDTVKEVAGHDVEGDGGPIAGGRKHKRSKKRSKHNKRRTTHKKQSRRRRRH